MASNPFTIAVPDASAAFDQFDKGYNTVRKVRAQSTLERLMSDPGDLDFRKMAGALAQGGETESALKLLVMGEARRKQDLENTAASNFYGTLGNILQPGSQQQTQPQPQQTAPRPGPQSFVNPSMQPARMASLGPADIPAGPPSAPGQNLTASNVTGIEYGPIEGNPAMFNRAPSVTQPGGVPNGSITSPPMAAQPTPQIRRKATL